LGGGKAENRFFYVGLFHDYQGREGRSIADNEFFLANADRIVQRYGVLRFLADIDKGRDYEGGSIVASCLDFLANEGFPDFLEDAEIPFKSSAAEFRQRYLLKALKEIL
jgi:hypothetical protein